MPTLDDLPRRVHRGLAEEAEDTGERFYEIEGVRYSTVAEAGIALGMRPKTVYHRCESSNYPDWIQHGRRGSGCQKDYSEAAEALKDPIEPAGWAFDGGAKRADVLDPNFDPPKVIRRMGWLKCLKCWSWVLSGDVAKQRKCNECGGEAGPRVPYSELRAR